MVMTLRKVRLGYRGTVSTANKPKSVRSGKISDQLTQMNHTDFVGSTRQVAIVCDPG